MAVNANSVATGKCYATSTTQVRRMLGIKGDQVTYEARGREREFGVRRRRRTGPRSPQRSIARSAPTSIRIPHADARSPRSHIALVLNPIRSR
jgi:hypothetical protein